VESPCLHFPKPFLTISHQHTEDRYNPGCSYVPVVPLAYGPEYSQSEETEEGFGYDAMQNDYATPQLFCPRPTSQLSTHFSSYDWPSESPLAANIYRAEQSQYPTQLEFPVAYPNYLGEAREGYTQEFIAPIPSFDQNSTHSTQPEFNFQLDFYYTLAAVSPAF
jgi:hypothetical protein